MLDADPSYLLATVRGGQLELATPLSLPDGARVAVWVLPAHEGELALPTPRLTLEFGVGILEALYQPDPGGFAERVKALRADLLRDWGVALGPVSLRDNLTLEPGGWRLLLDGQPRASARLYCDRRLVFSMSDAPLPSGAGVDVVDPAFGMAARWMLPADCEGLSEADYLVVEPLAVLFTTFAERVLEQLPALFGFEQLAARLEDPMQTPPALREALQAEQVEALSLLRLCRALLTAGRPLTAWIALLEAAALACTEARPGSAEWIAGVMAAVAPRRPEG